MVNQPGKLVVGRVHETGVQAAIGKYAGRRPPARLVVGRKIPANKDVPVRLKGDGIDSIRHTGLRIKSAVIGAGTGIKGRVNQAVGIELDNPVVAASSI